MTGQISEAFGLRALTDCEALIQVIRRNRLIVECHANGNRGAGVVVDGNPIDDSIYARSGGAVDIISIAFRIAVRPGELSEGSIRSPTFRRQAIVLYRAIKPDETGGDLAFSVGHQLFINLHLIFLADSLIVRLKDLFPRGRIVEELGRQNLVAGAFDDRADVVGSARRPNHISFFIERLKRYEHPAKSYA